MTTHAQPGAAARGFCTPPPFAGRAATERRRPVPCRSRRRRSGCDGRRDDEMIREPSNLRRDSAGHPSPGQPGWRRSSGVCASRDELSETALRSFQRSRFHRDQKLQCGTSGSRRRIWQRRFVGRINVGRLDHMSGSKTELWRHLA